jgi:hypothetical protein
VDAWIAAFTDDGVQMPPNAPANLGSERIRAWSRAFLAPFRVEFTLSSMKFRRRVAGRLKGAPMKST